MAKSGGNESYGQARRLGGAKAHEYPIVDSYKLGYRNREDITNLPPGVLIVGSQNVLTNVSERIQIRQGYELDGATSSVLAAILSSFDWENINNTEVHMRAGFLTSAGNDGKLQYRYVDPTTGAVTWRDLTTGLTTSSYNFTTYWNNTEKLVEVLYVNGTSNIYRWNGATTTLLSATVNTITKSGTTTWAEAGFYASGNKTIVINGNTYTYTGGENTTTLTGTTNATGEAVGSVIHQAVVTVANSALTNGMSSTFKNNLISVLNNQVYIGSLTNFQIWISKVNDYTTYTASSPRVTGDGATLTLDAQPVAFIPQENYMYVSAGKDRWYNISFQIQTSTVGVTYEQVIAQPLKTGKRQGARSQACVSHMKNNVITVTFEPTIDTFGRVETSLATPQTTNLSDSIKLDVDSYDWTDASIAYFRYYIYVAVPVEGLVLIFNLATKSWEAPQTLPVSRFYIVDGELYGHSYQTSESYKLFTGYADRVYTGFQGYPISSKAVFSYQNYGSRCTYKKANSFYVEGYINSNTILTAKLSYELDGCKQEKTFEINGSDTQIVCVPGGIVSGSLGKDSLGKNKFGGAGTSSLTGLPPKFRVELTFTNTDFFEVSPAFEVLGVDNRFELLAFGLNASPSTQEPVQIRQ